MKCCVIVIYEERMTDRVFSRPKVKITRDYLFKTYYWMHTCFKYTLVQHSASRRHQC